MYLELRHLRSLQAIDETDSLSEAAERVHLTQSALSHQIKAVENHFDLKLYKRKHKPLRLTSAGKRLLDLARRILPEVEFAEYEMKNLSGAGTGRLHITIECHSCFEWLVPTLDHYRKRWPEVEVDIRLGDSFEPIKALSNEDIDLVITTDKAELDDISFQALFDYEALCIMENDHVFSNKSFIQASDFVEQTLITYPVDKKRLDIFNHFLIPQKCSVKEIRQSELTVMILQLVAAGRGIAVLPDWVVDEYISRNYVSAKRIGEKGMHGTLFAAIRRREEQQEYLKDFIELAREGIYLKRASASNI